MMRRWLPDFMCVALVALLLATAAAAQAQVVSVQDLLQLKDFERDTGATVAPIYHGWESNADGTASMYFGYLNRNWKEEVDIPLGPDNFFEPGPQDHGQPAHFRTRLRKNIFWITVPKDFKGQFIWTLTIRGNTERVKATLAADAEINFTHFPQQQNTPPRVTGIGPDQRISLSEAATLKVTVVDDGLPTPRPGTVGLAVEWHKYRGPGQVTFSPSTPPVQDGVAVTTAKFSEPGTYVLQVLADDGSRTAPTSDCCWTTAVTTVTVNPAVASQKQ
jgi:hypothetical protein